MSTQALKFSAENSSELTPIVSASSRKLGRTVAGSLRFAGFALCLVAGACGKPDPGPVDFAQIKPMLAQSCAFSSCHADAGMTRGNLSLSAADAYCALVGATKGKTFRPQAQAQYPRRVVPGSKEQSFLYKKLILTAGESGSTQPLGTLMPLNQPLDQDTIDMYGRWIDEGAKGAQETMPCQ